MGTHARSFNVGAGISSYHIFNEEGELVCNVTDLRAGTFNAVSKHMTHVTEWEQTDVVSMDPNALIVNMNSIKTLHEYVLSVDVLIGHHAFIIPLVGNGDEYAGYLNTLCIEKPSARISWVFVKNTTTEIKNVPECSQWNKEWMYDGESWNIRRLKPYKVTPQKLIHTWKKGGPYWH